MAVNEVPIRGDGIRLGQFLKLTDAVDQGSDVKALLAEGEIQVNGDAERRRGRQLKVDDEVTVGTTTYRVTTL